MVFKSFTYRCEASRVKTFYLFRFEKTNTFKKKKKTKKTIFLNQIVIDRFEAKKEIVSLDKKL